MQPQQILSTVCITSIIQPITFHIEHERARSDYKYDCECFINCTKVLSRYYNNLNIVVKYTHSDKHFPALKWVEGCITRKKKSRKWWQFFYPLSIPTKCKTMSKHKAYKARVFALLDKHGGPYQLIDINFVLVDESFLKIGKVRTNNSITNMIIIKRLRILSPFKSKEIQYTYVKLIKRRSLHHLLWRIHISF